MTELDPSTCALKWNMECGNIRKQDGPSLESSSCLNVSLRYLGPWDPGTLEPLGLGTLGLLLSYDIGD